MSVTALTVAYTAATARMQPDPEASHPLGGTASVSYRQQFPIDVARCAIVPLEEDLDWTPNREQCVVPDPMLALCRRCPGRASCLAWALTGDGNGDPQVGYWAGTTSRDRAAMVEAGELDVAAAERTQAAARLESTRDALHAQGEGGLRWARKGCHCIECRRAGAAKRARSRARAAAAAA